MTTSPVNGVPYGRVNVLTSACFCVDIEGLLVAIFQECSGLSGEIEVETYQEGGNNLFAHKLPGRATYGNVTLKSGVAYTVDLWEWFCGVSTGQVKRRAVSIVMRSRGGDGGEEMRWNLLSAYPVRWQGPDFTAGDSNAAVHSLELAHNGIDLRLP